MPEMPSRFILLYNYIMGATIVGFYLIHHVYELSSNTL